MLLKKNFFLCLFAGIMIGLSSCKKEDPVDETTVYEDGFFIVNEGPFQTGSGTISFYSRKTGEVSNKIFESANNGEELGNIVQSMTIHNGLAYIVVNNSNKIVIADAKTFKKTGEITGLEFPRYFLPVNDEKAFISQWGADGMTGSIKVVNLVNKSISKTIATRPGPETLMQVGDFVYVANSGGFATDSVISKIDIATETIVKTIEVGNRPENIVQDKNGDLWALGYGDFNAWTNGALAKISGDNLEFEIETTVGAERLTINPEGDELFFIMDGATHSHSISSNTLSGVPFIPRYFYGLGFDPETGNLIALDPKDFQQDGQMIFYNDSGAALDSMRVGQLPRGFWFD